MLGGLGVHDLPLFVAAALLLNLTPGADMLFVAGTSAAAGRRAGMLAAWGVGAGCLVHVLLAAVGLSALVAASPWAFQLLTWAGAGYLVWLGVGLWRAQAGAARVETASGTGAAVFWRGAVTNALNPKVALFFLAFLPQFITPQAPGQAAAFVVLGLWFTAGGTVVNLVVAGLTALGRARLARSGAGGGSRWMQRAAGAVFVGLGLKLAWGATR